MMQVYGLKPLFWNLELGPTPPWKHNSYMGLYQK